MNHELNKKLAADPDLALETIESQQREIQDLRQQIKHWIGESDRLIAANKKLSRELESHGKLLHQLLDTASRRRLTHKEQVALEDQLTELVLAVHDGSETATA